jgi:large subunit ribosomal protein L9
MKVILLQQIPKVGKKGEVIEVSDGYAANALFPNKKAIPATAKNLEALNRKIESDKASKALEHGLLEAAIKSLPDMTVKIEMRANEKGHLFSKVGASEIVEALSKQRVNISVKNIVLKEPIKEVGSYPVSIEEGDYKGSITVLITSSK